MRILHLVGRSHHRGAELVALELAHELERFGHRSRLLAVGPGHEGGTEPDLPVLSGAARQHPVALAGAAWRLRRSLGREPADVVLAHGGAALQVAAVGGRGLPLVHQLIMGMPIHDRGRLWHFWWGRLLGRCAAVVSLTDALTDEVRTLGYRGPVELIANARSTARFDGLSRADEAARLRAELGLEPEVPLLGFVGHLVAQKRPDVAVEVADRLRTLGVDAHLVVVGGGPLATDVAAQVQRLDLARRVSLLGHRPDVARVLAGVDLLLLPSDSEGMPGVAIEAQMAGCPVVAFPVGGVAEVVATGESGLVLSDHDPGAMAEAVAKLLGDPERLVAMGAAARVRSEAFSMATAAERYHRVLTAAVGSGADGPDGPDAVGP
ncbi:MAG TPA: glycosyltransferase family 4 protein [Acidimicrobiales bacterium]|nr:glycosyltransferase family 4 protein [Acidimicrobiales bacterium]